MKIRRLPWLLVLSLTATCCVDSTGDDDAGADDDTAGDDDLVDDDVADDDILCIADLRDQLAEILVSDGRTGKEVHLPDDQLDVAFRVGL